MKIRYVLPAFAAAAALVLTGCVNNAESEGGGTDETPDASTSIQPDEAAVALLPAEVKDSGVLIHWHRR